MADLNDKKIAVIGGSSGIGYRVCELALLEGAHVVLGGRDQARLSAAAVSLSRIAPRVQMYPVDASSEESVAQFFTSLGHADHLVSMAGGAMGGGFATGSIDQIRDAIERKLFDNLRLAQHGSANLREGGSLLFTGGTGGKPHTASGAYLGNAALLSMAQSLAVELAPKLRVNVVAPTWMETPFWRNMDPKQKQRTKEYFDQVIPLGRTASIDEVASTYIFLMKNDFISGQQIAVDGGVMLAI